MRLLLIENNPHGADRVRSALGDARETAFELSIAEQLGDALELVKSGEARPEMVLMGITQPETAVLETLARMRDLLPEIPIVLLLESADQGFFIRAMRSGAQDYLVKSQVDAPNLARVMQIAVERKRCERARGELTMRESEARLRTITDNIPALIAYVGADRRYRFVNRFHEEWFGRQVDELTGKTMREVLGEEDYKNCREYVDQALLGHHVAFEQCMIRNNLERFLHIVYVPEYEGSKEVVGFYILGNNITERKLNETRLETIALYDALTGLANRLLLADRVGQAIAHAQRHSSSTGLIYLDLDGFKEVNDTAGHDVGDLLLREVAERLVSSVRQEDTVARLGGDEFVVAMWQVASSEDAARLAEKLISIVSQPYSIRGYTLTVTASAGVSIYPEQGENLETLMRNADLAMYEAKRAGKNAYRMLERTLQKKIYA